MKFIIVSIIRNSGDYPILLKEALCDLGHDVSVIGLDTDLGTIGEVLTDHGLHDRWPMRVVTARAIRRRARHVAPDVLLIYGTNWSVSPTFLRWLKRTYGCSVVLWEGNLRFWLPHQVTALREYDILFTTDSYILPLLRGPAGCKRAFYLSGLGAPQIFEPPEEKAIEKRFRADVSFFGSPSADRVRFFEQLAEIPGLKLWGNGWKASSVLLADAAQDGPVNSLEKAQIYAGTKVNIDLHAGRNHQINGFSSRVYEIPCCGGFVLTERRHDLERHFEVGRDIDTFASPQEAREKIHYYLHRPELRQEMAARLRSIIASKYTIAHSARTIAEMCLAVRSGPSV